MWLPVVSILVRRLVVWDIEVEWVHVVWQFVSARIGSDAAESLGCRGVDTVEVGEQQFLKTMDLGHGLGDFCCHELAGFLSGGRDQSAEFFAVEAHGLVGQIEGLKARSGVQRVAEFLLDLSAGREGEVSVALPYNKALIAGRLGIKPETLSRAFARLRDHGVRHVEMPATPAKIWSIIDAGAQRLAAE